MKRPLLAPLLGLILGISFVSPITMSPGGGILLSLGGFLFLFFSLTLRSSKGVFAGVVVLFAVLGGILGIQELKRIKQESNLLSWTDGGKSYVIGRVASSCEEGDEGARLVLEGLAIRREGRTEPLSGRLLLRIGQGDCPFESGDIVQTYTRLKGPDRYRNDSSFDYPFFLKTKGVTATAYVDSAQAVVKVGEETNRFDRFFSRLRGKVREKLETLSDPEDRRILAALLLGEKRALSSSTEDLFRRTGTTHLLVVSGLHMVMVGTVFYGCLRLLFSLWPPLLLRISARKWAWTAALIPIAAYAVLVGFSPSVLRAVLTTVLIGVMLLLSRPRDALGLLILTAFLLLVFHPLSLFDLSFQLSFLSVFFILLLVPPWERAVMEKSPFVSSHPWIRRILQVALASLAAQVGLLPLLVNRFYQLNLVSLPANLVLVPAFTLVLMPLGLLGMFLAWCSLAGAPFVFSLCAYFLHPLLSYLRFLMNLPGSAPYWPHWSWIQITLFYLLLLPAVVELPKKMKRAFVPLLLILNLGAWAWGPLADRFDSSFRIHFIDVGQGDATLLELPHGRRILVDGGGIAHSTFDVGEKVLLPYLFSKGIWKIDVIALTHPHPDHYGGLKAVLKAFRPGEFWTNGETVSAEPFQDLMKEAQKSGIPIRRLDASIPAFDWEGVRFEILHPPADCFFPLAPDSSTLNNHSFVLRLEFRGLSVLLAGDVEKEAEAALLQSGKIKPAWILKVPHHGSDTSSTEGWVEAVRPRFALIGVGRENLFGFPKSSVLARYESVGTQVFRTDEDGEVNLRWDGRVLRVETFTGKRLQWRPTSPSPGFASQGEVYSGSSSEF